MKTKLTYQDFGTKLIVIISGNNESDIEQRYWSFYNHGATDTPEPFKLTELSVYFYTTREKLLKAMTNASLFRLLDEAANQDTGMNCLKGCKGGAMPYAKAHAQNLFDSMERTTDLCKKYVRQDFYTVGTICAEKPDSDFSNRETT